MKKCRKAAILTAVLMTTFPTWSCPVCNSDTGRQVRAQIFGSDFGTTLLSVLAPFPVLLAVLGLIFWVPGLLEPKGTNRSSNV